MEHPGTRVLLLVSLKVWNKVILQYLFQTILFKTIIVRSILRHLVLFILYKNTLVINVIVGF